VGRKNRIKPFSPHPAQCGNDIRKRKTGEEEEPEEEK
jgi:hypothetical protein